MAWAFVVVVVRPRNQIELNASAHHRPVVSFVLGRKVAESDIWNKAAGPIVHDTYLEWNLFGVVFVRNANGILIFSDVGRCGHPRKAAHLFVETEIAWFRRDRAGEAVEILQIAALHRILDIGNLFVEVEEDFDWFVYREKQRRIGGIICSAIDREILVRRNTDHEFFF